MTGEERDRVTTDKWVQSDWFHIYRKTLDSYGVFKVLVSRGGAKDASRNLEKVSKSRLSERQDILPEEWCALRKAPFF